MKPKRATTRDVGFGQPTARRSPLSVGPSFYSTYVVAVLLAQVAGTRPSPMRAQQALRIMEDERGLALRCCLLLCLALDKPAAQADRPKKDHLSTETLLAVLEELSRGSTKAAAHGSDTAWALPRACAAYPQLPILARALHMEDSRVCVEQAILIHQELQQHEELVSAMEVALSHHLTQTLVGKISEDLAVELWMACPLSSASAHLTVDARGGHAGPPQGPLTVRIEELRASIDDLLARTVAIVQGKACGEIGVERTLNWDEALGRTIRAVWGAQAQAAKSSTATERAVEAERTCSPAEPAGATERSRLDKATARVHELLDKSALAIARGLKSAQDSVTDLVSAELVRRVLETGGESPVRASDVLRSLKSATTFKVPEAHMHLVCGLFPSRERWGL
jgi:hypothetical protein